MNLCEMFSVYCRTLYFSCILIWLFWSVEILLHFNLPFSQGVPGSKEGQGSQHRPIDSGRSVGPSAIPNVATLNNASDYRTNGLYWMVRSHLTMHRTIGLTDYYWTMSGRLMGYRTKGLGLGVRYSLLVRHIIKE